MSEAFNASLHREPSMVNILSEKKKHISSTPLTSALDLREKENRTSVYSRFSEIVSIKLRFYDRVSIAFARARFPEFRNTFTFPFPQEERFEKSDRHTFQRWIFQPRLCQARRFGKRAIKERETAARYLTLSPSWTRFSFFFFYSFIKLHTFSSMCVCVCYTSPIYPRYIYNRVYIVLIKYKLRSHVHRIKHNHDKIYII